MDFVIAIATVALVIITGYYAVTTRRLAQLTESQLQASLTPHLVPIVMLPAQLSAELENDETVSESDRAILQARLSEDGVVVKGRNIGTTPSLRTAGFGFDNEARSYTVPDQPAAYVSPGDEVFFVLRPPNKNLEELADAIEGNLQITLIGNAFRRVFESADDAYVVLIYEDAGGTFHAVRRDYSSSRGSVQHKASSPRLEIGRVRGT